MKIAVIGQKGIPSRSGGVEIHVEEIVTRLVKNHEITVYCRKNYCNDLYEEYKGVKIKYIKSINSKHLDAITYSFLATIDAIRNNVDIIHYHAIGPSLLAFLPKIFRKKVICTCHGLDWQRAKWGKCAKFMLKLGENVGANFSDKQIVVSEKLVDYYKDKYKKDAIYIPNGIERKNKIKANLIKSKFGLEKDEYILFLARLVPEKGAHYLIEAFNNLNTNKKLVIAGGSSHSDQYIKELKFMAKNNNRIIFTGFINGILLDELYTNAYLYVLPSEIEGLPISLLEAMAFGQCCLISNIRENIDVTNEYAESFINKNSTDLKEKLELLLNDTDRVEWYKNNSENYILQRYNWDNVAKLTNDVMLSSI